MEGSAVRHCFLESVMGSILCRQLLATRPQSIMYMASAAHKYIRSLLPCDLLPMDIPASERSLGMYFMGLDAMSKNRLLNDHFHSIYTSRGDAMGRFYRMRTLRIVKLYIHLDGMYALTSQRWQ
ncbi:hypothetical protein KIN20_033603 [Parelaphostrongylus tenuis]|uniref:Uncharacterized protein n=1 Tax=Parelaphostrongylus tenuis TaxID=148309 RepID=A0AAD5WIK3_PARTN|nr:hypothetical protein KIN20_033603 [Parelaphostrongylus tenuis]